MKSETKQKNHINKQTKSNRNKSKNKSKSKLCPKTEIWQYLFFFFFLLFFQNSRGFDISPLNQYFACLYKFECIFLNMQTESKYGTKSRISKKKKKERKKKLT